MEGPRRVRKKEFNELMRFLERVYGHPKGFFPLHYPAVWREETVDLENIFIIKEKGKIVSHVGLFPLNVRVGKKLAKVGGIGGVATLPEWRGKGLMTKLLNYAVKKMEEENYSFSVLWGDRQRYGNFGYELAGRQINLTLNKRSLEKMPNLSNLKLKRYEGKEIELKKIISMHKKEPFSVQRKDKDYKILLERPDIVTYLGYKNREDAYLILKENSVIEFGGNLEVILSSIFSLIQTFNLGNINISVPFKYPLLALFLKATCVFSVSSFCMLKIIDLRRILETFIYQIEERYLKSGMTLKKAITLYLSGTEQKATLLFDKGIKISQKEVKDMVILPEQEMVKLLFGTLPPDSFLKLEKEKLFLNFFFPLDFYIWSLDSV